MSERMKEELFAWGLSALFVIGLVAAAIYRLDH